MFWLVVSFIALGLLIVAAGTVLAYSGDHIGEHTRLGRSLAGVILLAGATSLPELMVGWSAVRIGNVDLTLGDLLGSCLMNLLILGLLDLFTRSPKRMLSPSAAAHALSANVTIVLAAVILLGLLLKSERVFLRLAPISWGLFLIYLFGIRLIHINQRVAASQDDEESSGRPRLRLATICYLLSAAVIVLAAPPLARTAEALAEKTGLGSMFFGTVFVAIVTSLPELVATITAIRIGAIELAVGNIFGSNSFNLLIVGIIDFANPEPITAAASGTHVVTAAAVIATTAVASLGLLYRAEKRWFFIEPDAALLITMVLGSLYLVSQF